MLKTVDRPAVAKIKTEIATITPQIAAAWLDANEKNRKISPSLVNRLAADMANGKFEEAGDTIRFSWDNKLIDGQHRLHACVKSQKSFKAIVVYGLDPRVQDVIDTGRGRSKGDMLALHGVSQANSAAVAFRLLHTHKMGHTPTSGQLTHADMVDLLDAHPKLPLYLPNAGVMLRGIPQGLVGFVGYAGAALLKKKDRVDAMMAVLKTGVPDYEGDPIHKFRERVIGRKGFDANGSKDKRHEVIWTFYYAWNLFAKKASVSRLNVQKEPVFIEWLKPSQL